MSPGIRDFLILAVNVFNDVIILYFVVANGFYSVLVGLSFVNVWLHQKRVGYAGLQEVRESPVTPPVTIIVPAFNEEEAILLTVDSLMRLDYPTIEIIVVDDGSTDSTLARLVETFQLMEMELIYRSKLPAKAPTSFFHNPDIPSLTVVTKPNGGKSDALNVGVNLARSPYVCTIDADCVIERDALLRLMYPIIRSAVNTVVSGGIVRIINGCKVEKGQVTEIRLPRRSVERFQVTEYLRSFLFGRTGWDLLKSTFVASGALSIFHREAVIEAGGFSSDTVTEDVDMVACIHRSMRERKRKYRTVFLTDPVCWTLAPHKLSLLSKQRRRWHLGLMQTIFKHSYMHFSFGYGLLGIIGFPWQVFIEAFGCVVELLGYILVPVTFLLGITPLSMFLMFILLALAYGALLSVASVLLEEITYRRYPRLRDLWLLLFYAAIENFGYRQLTVFYRVQGVWQYLRGKKSWEVVHHVHQAAN